VFSCTSLLIVILFLIYNLQDEVPSKVRRLSTAQCERSGTLYLNYRRKQLQKVKLKIVTTKTEKVSEQKISVDKEESNDNKKNQRCRRTYKVKANQVKREKEFSVYTVPVKHEDSMQEDNKQQCRRKNKLKVKVTGNATRRDNNVRVRENHIKIEVGKQTETAQRRIKGAQVKADMSNAKKQTRKGERTVGKKRSRVKKTLVVNRHVPSALSLLLLQDSTPGIRHDDDTLGKGHRKVKPRKKNQGAKLKIRQGTGI